MPPGWYRAGNDPGSPRPGGRYSAQDHRSGPDHGSDAAQTLAGAAERRKAGHAYAARGGPREPPPEGPVAARARANECDGAASACAVPTGCDLSLWVRDGCVGERLGSWPCSTLATASPYTYGCPSAS